MIDYNHIPNELKTLKQWVCVKAGSKAPQQALSPFPASVVKPSTWSYFEDAVESVRRGYHEYIGFVFNDNGIVGVDIDAGFDEHGTLTDIADDILRKTLSYTELSKSGRGFHILVRGEIPFAGKNNMAGVEVYKTGRFFIMTGNSYLNSEFVLEDQCFLDYVVKNYFPETRESTKQEVTPKIYRPKWEHHSGCRKIRIKPNYPDIPEGCRNICITSLAGALHSVGYPKNQIYREMLYANRMACKPPLEEQELVAIFRSVTKYKR